MKKIAAALLFFAPILGVAQIKKVPQIAKTNTFIIKGNVKQLKDGNKIYLYYKLNDIASIDSSKIVNGKFSFTGSTTSPFRADLFLNFNPLTNQRTQKIDALSIYIEPVNITVSVADSLKNALISGSKINDDDKRLKKSIYPIFEQMKSLENEFKRHSESERKDSTVLLSFKNRYDAISIQSPKIMEQFIRDNPNSYISLLLVGEMASTSESAVLPSKQLYMGLSPEIKRLELGVKLANFYAQIDRNQKSAQPALGEMALDFGQEDPNGKIVKLSDFKGKYVLLDFWASWCGPCRQENPNVVAAYNKFKDKGFTVLGVSLDRPGQKEAWLKAISTDHLTWTQVSDLKFWNNEAAKLYGINSIPANYLIDPTGKIVATGLREKALHDKLEELLGAKSNE